VSAHTTHTGATVTVAELLAKPEAPMWAKAFVAAVKENPSIATDEEAMRGWFANAMMAIYDHLERRRADAPPQLRITE
jgi:hypothetical protein